MESAYTYQPLPDPANSIRLLSIEPGWPSDPIRVSITNISNLDQSPPYQALSYVWGSVQNPVMIECDGEPMEITRNLATALVALRQLPADGDPATNGVAVMEESHILHSKHRAWKGIARNRNEIEIVRSRRANGDPPLFWIDALCINQRNIQECAEQVKLMRRLYTTASTVCIWLGSELIIPEAPESKLRTSRIDLAFGRTRLAELDPMAVVLSFFAQALRNSDRVKFDEYGLPEVDLLGFPSQKSPEYKIFGAFFNQAYFHRVWIVQEAVLAQEAKVLVGPWEFDWKPFAEAVHILDAGNLRNPFTLQLRVTGVVSEESSSGVDIPSALYLCQIQRLPGRKENLFPLLNKSRTRKATKDSDHVFAVLGLAGDVANADELSQKLVAVDYEKPVAQVFRDATWFIILSHATLRPLAAAEFWEDRRIPDCPSWVPIWSEPRRTSGIDYELFNTDAGQKLRMEKSENSNQLKVFGYSFESITSITGGLVDEKAPIRTEDELIEWHYPPRQEEIDFVKSAWILTTDFYQSLLNGSSSAMITTQDLTSQLCVPTCYASDEGVFRAFVRTCTLSAQTTEASLDDRGNESEDMIDSAEAWFQQSLGWASHPASLITKVWHTIRDKWYPGAGMLFQASLLRSCMGRKFFLTTGGFMGIGPASMRPDDLVVVILGVTVPFIVRKTGTQESPSYILIGECYVNGIMDGELVQAQQRAGKEAELFTFI
ncbi:heterokaryon incompatibility protein-domain-containing protein [Hypoxylon sp. FL0543]|nr:heterokaryon incompatibility protein-domain-containing protein [Hypoxylon sp. FL0543]